MNLHKDMLSLDLCRLNVIVGIARNLVTTGKEAQHAAVFAATDVSVVKLVELCARVTARPYDGDAGPMWEDQWTATLNECKPMAPDLLPNRFSWQLEGNRAWG
jgi:palmitoyltransferase